MMNRRRQRNYKRNYERKRIEKRPTGGGGSSSLVQRLYTTDCKMGEYWSSSQYSSDLEEMGVRSQYYRTGSLISLTAVLRLHLGFGCID